MELKIKKSVLIALLSIIGFIGTGKQEFIYGLLLHPIAKINLSINLKRGK